MPLIQEWFSAAEIAAAGLTGMPASKRRVWDLALRAGWQRPIDEGKTWRKRAGRGGGVEFHVSVLPPTARIEMQARHRAEGAPPAKSYAADPDRAALWDAYGRLTGKKKTEAERRLTILLAVDDAEKTGMTRHQAVLSVCAEYGITPATYYNWCKIVLGVPRPDWLAQLAPQHKGSGRRCDIPEAAATYLQSLYMQPLRWTVDHCIREARKKAKIEGWSLPSDRTLARHLARLDPMAVALARDGERGLDRLVPGQRRDRTGLYALEAVNADGHQFDVMCRWPDGTEGRPVLVGFQDLYSGMVVSWRLGASETSKMVRLAYGEMAEARGVPAHAFFDNGRAFASKENTGGTPNRYRFKVKPEDVEGVLPACGTKVTFVKPEHGQSKPIERAFGDMAENIAKDIRCAGAYLGNSPMNKPADYGARAVPIELFERIVREGIEEHNSRPNRRSAVCQGKYSFRDVFEVSLKTRTVPRLDPAQRTFWLLSSKIVTVREPDATVWIGRERYFQDGSLLHRYIGKRVTVRFDDADPTADVLVFNDEGRMICKAEHIPDRGFMDREAAKQDAERRGARKKKGRALERALAPHSQDALVALRPDAGSPAQVDGTDPKVVRLVSRRAAQPPRPVVDDLPEHDEAENFLRAIGDNARALRRLRDGGG